MSYPADPYWSYVKNLLLCEGANGDKRIPDEKGNRWTVGANAALSSAQRKFGNTSLRLDGSVAGYLSINNAWAWTGVDLTIEAWV